MQVDGKMRVKWVELEGGALLPREEHQILLQERLKVFTPDRKKENSFWIFPGRHEYK